MNVGEKKMPIAEHLIKKEIEEYLSNVDKVDEIDGEYRVIEGLTTYKVDKIKEKFDNIKSELNKQRDETTYDIEVRNSQKRQEMTYKKDVLWEKISDFRKKIKYLELAKEIEKKSLKWNDKSITNRGELQKLGVFYKDKYMLIKLYIAENSKPKNKYSLIAYGITKFGKDFLDCPYSYGLPTSDFGCACNIRAIIKDLPTIEEIKGYLERNKDNILQSFIGRYKSVLSDYLSVINRYSLNDFKEIYKPKEVSDKEAVVVCIVDRKIWRLYKDFYYQTAKKIKGNYTSDYIKVNGQLYKRMCRKELMMITQTGNTMFGDWWSMSLEQNPYQRNGVMFTRENYEKMLAEAKQFVDSRNKNRRGKKVHFSYPRIKWINDHLIRHIEDKLVEI